MGSSNYKDYYGILEIKKNATDDEIKKSFRRLARKYHPDVNPGNKEAEESFKGITEAYEVLSDADKRKKYDQFGQYWKQAAQQQDAWKGSGGQSTTGMPFDFGQYNDFQDFINELLGKTSSQPSAGGSPFRSAGGWPGETQATSSQANINLTFVEGLRGVKKKIQLNGESIDLTVPAGVKTGDKLRIAGKGGFDPLSQRQRDLILNIQLQKHSFFQFEGDNLVCEIPITPDEAVLGTQLDIPTVNGSVNMKIPAGVKSGQSFRLKGKGWPGRKGSPSDQIVKVVIVVPTSISQEEREYYEKLKKIKTFEPRKNLTQIKV